MFGTRMLDQVMQRFLRDSIDRLFGIERDGGFIREVRPYVDAVPALDRISSFGERSDQAFTLERFRLQFQDQAAHIGERRLCKAEDVIKWLHRSLRIAGETIPCRPGPQGYPVQRLRHGIVQLARETLPFSERDLILNGADQAKDLG